MVRFRRRDKRPRGIEPWPGSLVGFGKKGKTVRGERKGVGDRQIYGTATSFSQRGGLDLTRSEPRHRLREEASPISRQTRFLSACASFQPERTPMQYTGHGGLFIA